MLVGRRSNSDAIDACSIDDLVDSCRATKEAREQDAMVWFEDAGPGDECVASPLWLFPSLRRRRAGMPITAEGGPEARHKGMASLAD
jgi:hypothetical protein